MEIITLNRDEIVTLMEMVSRADAEDKSFRMVKTFRGISFKVGEGMWTAPMGTKE